MSLYLLFVLSFVVIIVFRFMFRSSTSTEGRTSSRTASSHEVKDVSSANGHTGKWTKFVNEKLKFYLNDLLDLPGVGKETKKRLQNKAVRSPIQVFAKFLDCGAEEEPFLEFCNAVKMGNSGGIDHAWELTSALTEKWNALISMGTDVEKLKISKVEPEDGHTLKWTLFVNGKLMQQLSKFEQLPGVGEMAAKRWYNKGFRRPIQVFGKYLELSADEDEFINFCTLSIQMSNKDALELTTALTSKWQNLLSFGSNQT